MENENATTMSDLLTRLKIDIGIINSTTYDTRLTSLLNAARGDVEHWIGEAIDLDNISDAELIIDYARWQWLSRREPTAMSPSLKYRLNCRAFARAIPQGGSAT